ncbi:RING-H2 finger protein ATL43 [Malania oleifera]|uniref:RING-H2 finger protein ATL43 n=1 Tax=Malania oleifera TaxID=397392 RepID=UPI0025AD9D0B|nr:RING-H2 finger protein ATL43 [Malania oleifera]
MGVFKVLVMLDIHFLFFFFFFFHGKPVSSENDIFSFSVGARSNIAQIDVLNSNPPLSPQPHPPDDQQKTNFSPPFRPGIVVIVGVLTTIFSITFLVLLYAKHCKRRNGVIHSGNPNSWRASSAARKNSGVDRSVIESLPVFQFNSLRGHKEGLDCAVCLNRFEPTPTELLKFLPKCKHAFHIECLDTWLDAHSTCPLCRSRVNPEDVLLNIAGDPKPPLREPDDIVDNKRCRNDEFNVRRVSGRHSSAGEQGNCDLLQIVLQTPGESAGADTASSSRRSLDSLSSMRRKNESATVECFDRSRKDDRLPLRRNPADAVVAETRRRLEHRIMVTDSVGGFHQRWSDVQPSDLLYLRSEMMMISGCHRCSSSLGSQPSFSSRSRQQRQKQQQQLPLLPLIRRREVEEEGGGARSVINERCVSEITGLSRFSNRTSNSSHRQQRQAGFVWRWKAWISPSRPSGRLG